MRAASRITGGCWPPSDVTGDDLPLLWQLRFSHFNEKARAAVSDD
jgi:hypothetical protein